MEPNKTPPKIWRVVTDVSYENLERELNILANDGYHVQEFIKDEIHDSDTGRHERVTHLVAVNPTRMGASRMQDMQEMLAKFANEPFGPRR